MESVRTMWIEDSSVYDTR